MAVPAQTNVEYVGFTNGPAVRVYALLVKRAAGEFQEFRVSIPHEAFLTGRVRYQDGPEICFQRLQRELTAVVDGVMPAASLAITEDDLHQYRQAHMPPVRRSFSPPRPKPAE